MAMFDVMEKGGGKNADRAVQRQNRFTGQDNHTGIPTQLKERLEESTGLSFDDVRVRYNSALPARLDALAYTQGNRVEIAPGQERHLPHELGHVVQQKLGVVRANARHFSGVEMNTDEGLERQADEIGAGKKVKIAPKTESSVVQRCREGDAESINGRKEVQDFFSKMKKNQGITKLNLYSFILSDGLGDAGQLKLLYDKVSSKAAELKLNAIRIMCGYTVPLKEMNGYKEVNGDLEIQLSEEEKNGHPAYTKREKIKNILNIESSQDMYFVDPRNTDIKHKGNDCREKIFKKLGTDEWEVEYPVPDQSFDPGNKQLLKIKEMGVSVSSSVKIRAGDVMQGGIGYGIPDTPVALPDNNENSAEEFLKAKIKGGEQFSLKTIDELLDKAWIVSIKNYELNQGPPSLEAKKKEQIKEDAKGAEAKLIIFVGMEESSKSDYKDGLYVICENHIPHEQLVDLMTKVKNGVVLSGGEGLYVESLAATKKQETASESGASQEQETASVFAARYGFQYREIANALMDLGSKNLKTYKREDGDEPLSKYRFFATAEKPRKFWYYNNEKFFNIVFDRDTQRMKSKEKSQSNFNDNELKFSPELSALYLPLHLNYGSEINEMPTIFKSISDIIKIFGRKEYKDILRNESWFKLIDKAAATTDETAATAETVATAETAATTATDEIGETDETRETSNPPKCCIII